MYGNTQVIFELQQEVAHSSPESYSNQLTSNGENA